MYSNMRKLYQNEMGNGDMSKPMVANNKQPQRMQGVGRVPLPSRPGMPDQNNMGYAERRLKYFQR